MELSPQDKKFLDVMKAKGIPKDQAIQSLVTAKSKKAQAAIPTGRSIGVPRMEEGKVGVDRVESPEQMEKRMHPVSSLIDSGIEKIKDVPVVGPAVGTAADVITSPHQAGVAALETMAGQGVSGLKDYKKAGSDFMEFLKGDDKKGVQALQDIIEGTFKIGTAPIAGVISGTGEIPVVGESIESGLETGAKYATPSTYINMLGDAYAEQKGIEKGTPEYDEFYENTIRPLSNVVDIIGVKLAPKAIKETKAKIIDPLKENVIKPAEAKLAETFANMKQASAEKAGVKVEKLATELLQPSKNQIKLAKLAGDSTSNAVKEYIKVAEQVDSFDTALQRLAENTSKDFVERNRILQENNFKIDPIDAVQRLEKHIATTEAKKLTPKPVIEAMKEVLANEKEWLAKNNPDRVSAQARKEEIYKEAKPLYKKQEAGNALGSEQGRIKAFEQLGKGYKKAVEAGDVRVRDINASYGGKMGAMEMLAGRSALALKAISPTLLQKLAGPIVDLISASTGAGSAAFVAKLAAKQQSSLPKITQKIVDLREKASQIKQP
ncbi:hypothetical protein KBA63_00030 [Candidatus Woesebacteria bacterium]|nr:hypothetical protein [Candidatus Woesebacteria bacterium]